MSPARHPRELQTRPGRAAHQVVETETHPRLLGSADLCLCSSGESVAHRSWAERLLSGVARDYVLREYARSRATRAPATTVLAVAALHQDKPTSIHHAEALPGRRDSLTEYRARHSRREGNQHPHYSRACSFCFRQTLPSRARWQMLEGDLRHRRQQASSAAPRAPRSRANSAPHSQSHFPIATNPIHARATFRSFASATG